MPMEANDTVEILLVEDNPGDIRLTQEALKDLRISNRLSVIEDGASALAYLRQEGPYKDVLRPDLILLDLNLPRLGGRELLEVIKTDEDLKRIPVVVLTTSSDEQDILESYNLHANCYITKPVGLNEFLTIVKTIQNFWFSIVKLPPE